ncbi:MAG TPA: SIMPL domain-containing protein [Pyrinomonadaceae bacterium]|nr:SIMPL domain-containing protein [Pyrinomonadaceae bacterium]
MAAPFFVEVNVPEKAAMQENERVTEMSRKLITILGVFTLVAMFAGQTFAKEITVRGKLQRTVEAGGWVIVSGTEKYLVLNSRQFQNQKWFGESSEVEAVGETKPDVMTMFMEGTPFEVRTMRPFAAGVSGAVQTGVTGLTKVMVTGDSIVQAQPDTAILTISVVSQARNALDAQQDNATRSEAVIRAVKSAAGAGAEVKTSGYSLQPIRVYKEGMPPTITGYEARNSVTVIMSDLTRVGPVIDAAAGAGANDVAGVSFTLRKDRPARDQALGDATREAVSKAQVIAQALGGRVVRILEVQEEGIDRPRPVYENMQTMRVGMASTPIEVGSLDITSRVQLVAEVEVGAR